MRDTKRQDRKPCKARIGIERLDQRIAPSGFAAPGAPIPGHPGDVFGGPTNPPTNPGYPVNY